MQTPILDPIVKDFDVDRANEWVAKKLLGWKHRQSIFYCGKKQDCDSWMDLNGIDRGLPNFYKDELKLLVDRLWEECQEVGYFFKQQFYSDGWCDVSWHYSTTLQKVDITPLCKSPNVAVITALQMLREADEQE
ncbi:MAG: hypothetical protein KJ556_21070 [Gammaproteobacteria bacterium]|nr:hypothetical protein [Gammaproteobacteria bacterium]